MLDEWEGKQSLKAADVPVPEGQLVNAAGACAAAEEIGFPVVVKLVNADLPHKTEAGAVKINLKDVSDVAQAVTEIVTSVERYDNTIKADVFLVEKMLSRPVAELLVGIRQDPTFGLVMVKGTGGTLVELLRDTATLLLPASRDDIAAALCGLKVSTLLDGYRGAVPADREAVLDAITALANFAVKHRETLMELDVNPLMALENGAAAADVLMRVMPVNH